MEKGLEGDDSPEPARVGGSGARPEWRPRQRGGHAGTSDRAALAAPRDDRALEKPRAVRGEGLPGSSARRWPGGDSLGNRCQHRGTAAGLMVRDRLRPVAQDQERLPPASGRGFGLSTGSSDSGRDARCPRGGQRGGSATAGRSFGTPRWSRTAALRDGEMGAGHQPTTRLSPASAGSAARTPRRLSAEAIRTPLGG